MERKSVLFKVRRPYALQLQGVYCSPYIIWVIRQERKD